MTSAMSLPRSVDLDLRMRLDRAPHVGERPAFDDRERFEHDAPFGELAQDFLRTGLRRNFVVPGLDLRRSRARAGSISTARRSARAPRVSSSASTARTVAPGLTTSGTDSRCGPAALMTASAALPVDSRRRRRRCTTDDSKDPAAAYASSASMCAREARCQGIHAEGMLAHASHRHNPDARIGDEYLIRRKHVVERQALFRGSDAERGALAQHDAAHHAGDTAAVHARRHQHAGAHDEHIAHGARHQVSRRIEQQGFEDIRCAASAAASTFSSRLRCLMPASAGFSPSRSVATRSRTPDRARSRAARRATATRHARGVSVPCGA